MMLVVGCGLVGSALTGLARREGWDVRCTSLIRGDLRLDVTQRGDVLEVVRDVGPDVVVHTAALTDVDRCEVEQDLAWKVNVEGTGNVAVACEKVGAKMVYISTDYVFNGERGCYREGDSTGPINYYGLTKLEGEKRVMETSSDWIVARPSVVFGASGLNFATWLIRELGAGRRVNVLVDQFTSPTFNLDLAEMILALVERDENGVFHTSGRERVNRLDFALKLARRFHLDESLLVPIKMEEIQWKAKRPRDSSLSVEKISSIKRPLDVEEALERLQWGEGF